MICYLRILVLLLFWSTPSCSSFGPHRLLVFMSPRVLSVHASSSLPLRGIKRNKNPGRNSHWKEGLELQYSSRNSYYKNLAVAGAACCGELWRGVSIKILRRFRAQRCCPHQLKKRCAACPLAFGFSGPPCFSKATTQI